MMRELKSSAPLHAVGPDEVLAQLEQVLAAEHFRKSPSLSHLLRYVVTAAVNGQSDHLKETVIGIEVFGRRADFDCRIDNIVRVQAHRLRKSLEAYYADEGSVDRIRFEIPKGTYIPQWRFVAEPHAEPVVVPTRPIAPEPDFSEEIAAIPIRAEAPAVAPRPQSPAAATDELRPPAKPTRNTPLLAAAFLAGLACAAGLVMIPGVRKAINTIAPETSSHGETLHQGALADIWKPFAQPSIETIASFTNPAFLRSSPGVFVTYQGPLSAPTGTKIDISPNDPNVNQDLIRKLGSRFFFSDSWTGTGEVMAVHKITRLFADSGANLKVQRSRALSYEDIRRSNLIFIGAPWGNPILDKIRAVETPLVCCEGSQITNRAPKPGEPATYLRTHESATGELTTVYGLFSVLPGIAPGRKTAISAGLTTHGTWSAIDYVTSQQGAAEIARRLREQNNGAMPDFFQAVIRTAIIDGEPSGSSLVIARKVDTDRPTKP